MKKKAPFLTLILLSSIFIAVFYGKVLQHPNSFLFDDSGDGLKNYYTYYYHSVNDTSYTDFAGMNYPYGENYLYTDCHPLIANTFQFLGNFSEDISDYPIGFLNLIMIISIYLTFFLVYKLLLEIKINAWIAVIFAIAITLLQPQIFRITGHYALSYSIAIPLTWLLLIKSYNNDRKASWLWLVFATNIFWFFIHAYLGMILVLFQIAFYIIVYINDKIHRKGVIMRHLRFLFVAIIPPAIFRLYVFLTDTHLYRTENPSGFFLYNAEPDDILIAHHPPIRPLLNKIPGLDINLEWEAWSYIGLVFALIIIYILILSITRLFAKKVKPIFDNYFNQPILNISLLASLIVLLFAFAFPFKLLPALADYIPGIKQFTSTGRFAWVFFYIGSAFSVYVIQHLFNVLKRQNKAVIAYLLVSLAGLFTIYEGVYYHIDIANKITRSKNLFLIKNLDNSYKDAFDHIDFNRYQAIIPLPFYYIGSESFSRPVSDQIEKISMLFSAYTKLPLVGAYLTRTSIPESKNIVQLMSPAYYSKKIKSDIPSEKPFLVVVSNEDKTNYEKDLLIRSTLLFTTPDFSLFKLEKNELFVNSYEKEIKQFDRLKPILRKYQDFLISNRNAFIYYNDFEKQPSEIAFNSEGAYSGLKKGKNEFAAFEPYTFENNKTYIVSAWMYNNHPDALNLWLRFMVEEFDEQNNKWLTTTVFPEYSEVIYDDWSLIELEFKIHDPRNRVYIASKGKENSKADLHLDDLFIYEKGTFNYKIKRPGSSPVLFKNNQEIRRN